jgi:membrane protein implicated in regulation of membrane protease activity
MNTLYLICFVLGLVLSLLAAFAGLGRLHFGHLGHSHVGHAHNPAHMSALNGFTLPAFLCWFGGAGYLLNNYSPLITPLVLLIAVVAGLLGAALLYAALFKFLLPRERVLTEEDTRMDGVVARVSDEIRADGGTGEILFTQLETRRSAAARSETGAPIPRGTEVVVLRYVRGIAYVTPLETLMNQ